MAPSSEKVSYLVFDVESVADGEQNVEQLSSRMRQTLLGQGDQSGVDKIDYAVIVDADTLSPIARLDRPAVATEFFGQVIQHDQPLLTCM